MVHCVIGALVVASLAYVIWLKANKETGTLKLVGQALSVLLVVVLIAAAAKGHGCMGKKSCPMQGMTAPAAEAAPAAPAK